MRNHELHSLLETELQPFEPLPPGPYVVYGAGNIGREVAGCLTETGRSVCGFIDARVTGTVNGVPVHLPTADATRRCAAEGATAVIGVFNYAVDPLPILALLQEIGFRRIVSFNEFQELCALPHHYWLTSRAHVLQHADQLSAVWNMLADDVSRNIFLDVIRLRVTQDLRLLRQPTSEEQYLPHDLPPPRMPLRLVDGGAFNGDTLAAFLSKDATFEAVAAFEPDPSSFRTLSEWVRRQGSRLGHISLWPCGLSDTTGLARFQSGAGAGSALADKGDLHVQLAALDQVLPSFAPTYIKLDIEGSEAAALRGATETIRRHRPSLAVCAYHRPEDLWELPLYMRELLPSHRIAMRYHTYQGFDLVAYAFPAE